MVSATSMLQLHIRQPTGHVVIDHIIRNSIPKLRTTVHPFQIIIRLIFFTLNLTTTRFIQNFVQNITSSVVACFIIKKLFKEFNYVCTNFLNGLQLYQMDGMGSWTKQYESQLVLVIYHWS